MGYFSRYSASDESEYDVDMERTLMLYLEKLESKAILNMLNNEENETKGELLYRIPYDPLVPEDLDYLIEKTCEIIEILQQMKYRPIAEKNSAFKEVDDYQRLLNNYWDYSDMFAEAGIYKRILQLISKGED